MFPFSEPGGASGLATIFRNSPSGERESAWIVLQNMSYKEQGHIAKSREPSAALPLAAVPSPSTERRQPQSKRPREPSAALPLAAVPSSSTERRQPQSKRLRLSSIVHE